MTDLSWLHKNSEIARWLTLNVALMCCQISLYHAHVDRYIIQKRSSWRYSYCPEGVVAPSIALFTPNVTFQQNLEHLYSTLASRAALILNLPAGSRHVMTNARAQKFAYMMA